MSVPATDLLSNKFLSSLKVCTEADKDDKEDKKSSEKEVKSIQSLIILDHDHVAWQGDRHQRASSLYQKAGYSRDHFGAVPTPPPDLS